MPGVEVVEEWSFTRCDALTDVECGKLEIIGEYAFFDCESLRSIIFPSIKFIKGRAFFDCAALANVKLGNKLEEIGEGAFLNCHSLERITIPLKDGMITDNNVFQGCENLKHVDLILPNTSAGDSRDNAGGKAQAIRTWIRSVLHKIDHYKAQHQHYLKEAATTLQLALPSDIRKTRKGSRRLEEEDEVGRGEAVVSHILHSIYHVGHEYVMNTTATLSQSVYSHRALPTTKSDTDYVEA
eukprot:scaffold21639_cov77-Skeletonema_dohrnii-CCMP3373.AAC.1